MWPGCPPHFLLFLAPPLYARPAVARNLRRSVSAIGRAGRRVRAWLRHSPSPGGRPLPPARRPLLPSAVPRPARPRPRPACTAERSCRPLASAPPSFSASAPSPLRTALASPARDSVRPPCASARARAPAFRAPSCRPPSRARASPGPCSRPSVPRCAPQVRARSAMPRRRSARQCRGRRAGRLCRGPGARQPPPPFAPRADTEINKGLDTFRIFPLPLFCRQVERPWPDPPPPSGRQGAHLRDAAPAGRAAPGGRPGRGCPRPGCARPRPWRAASRLYGPVFSPVA